MDIENYQILCFYLTKNYYDVFHLKIEKNKDKDFT